MRRAIEFLLTRALRSRLGIAVALAVVILGIVGAARAVSGPFGTQSGRAGVPIPPITTVHPTTGDDGVLGDAAPTPTTSPGAASPEEVARDFATAWVTHRGVPAERWHAALRPLVTDELTKKLVGVDPATVPADQLTGDPVSVAHSAGLVEVLMSVDTGRLRLELVAPQGRWLVDAVDWERN